MKSIQKTIAAVLTIGTFGVLASTQAAETDIQVTASVGSTCSIISAQDLSFGQLNPSAATDQSTSGNVQFACTRDTNWTLSANNGANFDSTAGKRRMKNGSDYLPYALTQATFTGTGQGFGTPQSVTMNASVLGADYQNLPAVSFSDTLHLTLLP